MFISNVALTLRDLLSYMGGLEPLLDTQRYEITDWNTSAHYRLIDENTVNLGGSYWGTLEDLLKKEVLEMGFMDGKMFEIRLEG